MVKTFPDYITRVFDLTLTRFKTQIRVYQNILIFII